MKNCSSNCVKGVNASFLRKKRKVQSRTKIFALRQLFNEIHKSVISNKKYENGFKNIIFFSEVFEFLLALVPKRVLLAQEGDGSFISSRITFGTKDERLSTHSQKKQPRKPIWHDNSHVMVTEHVNTLLLHTLLQLTY